MDRGADIHHKGGSGRTAISFAKSIEMLKLLASRGGKVNERLVKENGTWTTVQYFLAKSQEMVEFLLENGCDIHDGCSDGDTLLHLGMSN